MDLKIKAEIATEVVALLEKAQESRPLSTAELSLLKTANKNPSKVEASVDQAW
jgi:hypothetical protein